MDLFSCEVLNKQFGFSRRSDVQGGFFLESGTLGVKNMFEHGGTDVVTDQFESFDLFLGLYCVHSAFIGGSIKNISALTLDTNCV